MIIIINSILLQYGETHRVIVTKGRSNVTVRSNGEYVRFP